MFGSRLFACSAFCCALLVSAQTYSPKAVRLQGAGELDQTQILKMIDLTPGTAISKEQIESAMQRLADSGLFSNLSYRVDDAALVFVLEPAAGTQAQPVRYTNFVWWPEGQLEPLVEARVPLFHGKLPLTGQLTSQVEAALVALLAEKGVAGAKVEAIQVVDGSGVSLTITQPEITVGAVHVTGIAPETTDQMNKVTAELASRDFNSAETPATIRNNTLDTQRNAGYLDVSVDPPVFSLPHKAMQGYAVDASEAVRPGALYRIAGITFTGVDATLEPEVAKAAGLKDGDPAGQMVVSIAAGLAARALSNHGNLEAKATLRVVKNSAAHTAAYAFALDPGPVYSFAAVDVTALSATAQDRFKQAFHVAPGAVADKTVTDQLGQALQGAGVLRSISIRQKLDRSTHTVTYVVMSRAAAGN